eukprot:jgi/Mesvir1/3394/Mv05093-RA.1
MTLTADAAALTTAPGGDPVLVQAVEASAQATLTVTYQYVPVACQPPPPPLPPTPSPPPCQGQDPNTAPLNAMVVESTVGFAPLGWSRQLSLPAFDASEGSLQGVAVRLRASLEGDVAWENLGNDTGGITVTLAMRLSAQLLANTTGTASLFVPLELRLGRLFRDVAQAYDGVPDLGGRSGNQLAGRDARETGWIPLGLLQGPASPTNGTASPSSLSEAARLLFSYNAGTSAGGGSHRMVDFQLIATDASSVLAPAGVLAQFHVAAKAALQVRYDYRPAPDVMGCLPLAPPSPPPPPPSYLSSCVRSPQAWAEVPPFLWPVNPNISLGEPVLQGPAQGGQDLVITDAGLLLADQAATSVAQDGPPSWLSLLVSGCLGGRVREFVAEWAQATVHATQPGGGALPTEVAAVLADTARLLAPGKLSSLLAVLEAFNAGRGDIDACPSPRETPAHIFELVVPPPPPLPAAPSLMYLVSEWGECSATCGGGTQVRSVRCGYSNGTLLPSDMACEVASNHQGGGSTAPHFLGERPPSSQPCNVGPCPAFFWALGPWSDCTRSCGGGLKTRRVWCQGAIGQPAPRDDSCANAGPRPAVVGACNTEACGCTRFVREVGPWGPCVRNTRPAASDGDYSTSIDTVTASACGGGTTSRSVACVRYFEDEARAEATPDLCAGAATTAEGGAGWDSNLAPVGSTRPCDTSSCSLSAWRAGPWGPCAMDGPCDTTGLAARNVTCHLITGQGEVITLPDAEAAALCGRVAERPSSIQECTRDGPVGNDDSVPPPSSLVPSQILLLTSPPSLLVPPPPPPLGSLACDLCVSHNCSGHGRCDGHTGDCVCDDGYVGDVCQGRLCQGGEEAGRGGQCCDGTVVSITGDCCQSPSAVRDASGRCCESGALDVCGVCDGGGIVVDAMSRCCTSAVLDAAGLCCPSGSLDHCGVCDGTGDSCGITLTVTLEPWQALATVQGGGGTAAGAAAQASGGQWSSGPDASARESRGANLTGREGRKEDGDGAVARMTGRARRRLLVRQPLRRRLSAASVAEELLASRGQNVTGPARVLFEDAFVRTMAQVLGEYDPALILVRQVYLAPNATGGDSTAGGGEGAGGVAGAQAEPGDLLAVEFSVLPPPSPLPTQRTGSTHGRSAGEVVDALARWLASLVQPDISPLPPLRLTRVPSRYAPVPVCGNGVCEVLERCPARDVINLPPGEGAALGQNGSSPAPAEGCCLLDCPLSLFPCVRSGPNGRECGGHGTCLHGTGACECYAGYTGADCRSCQAGWFSRTDPHTGEDSCIPMAFAEPPPPPPPRVSPPPPWEFWPTAPPPRSPLSPGSVVAPQFPLPPSRPSGSGGPPPTGGAPPPPPGLAPGVRAKEVYGWKWPFVGLGAGLAFLLVGGCCVTVACVSRRKRKREDQKAWDVALGREEEWRQLSAAVSRMTSRGGSFVSRGGGFFTPGRSSRGGVLSPGLSGKIFPMSPGSARYLASPVGSSQPGSAASRSGKRWPTLVGSHIRRPSSLGKVARGAAGKGSPSQHSASSPGSSRRVASPAGRRPPSRFGPSGEEPLSPGSPRQQPYSPGSARQQPYSPGSARRQPYSPGAVMPQPYSPGSRKHWPGSPGSEAMFPSSPTAGSRSYPTSPTTDGSFPASPNSSRLGMHPLIMTDVVADDVMSPMSESEVMAPPKARAPPSTPMSFTRPPMPGTLLEDPDEGRDDDDDGYGGEYGGGYDKDYGDDDDEDGGFGGGFMGQPSRWQWPASPTRPGTPWPSSRAGPPGPFSRPWPVRPLSGPASPRPALRPASPRRSSRPGSPLRQIITQ